MLPVKIFTTVKLLQPFSRDQSIKIISKCLLVDNYLYKIVTLPQTLNDNVLLWLGLGTESLLHTIQ